ncbi:MAG: DUF1822 family protein [Scytonematopsis contorta HA4267-MV1]|jgi:hypothetical protein|nr:DUF1822 family protein [Scytonematopsis contorta HA4267-MV1]
MINTSESFSFAIPISSGFHNQAHNFCQKHRSHQKLKQIYLNTLAASTVDFYLRCMGIETDWENSQICNPAMQALMNVAELKIPHLGSLECRPVLPKASVMQIPLEVATERIGYVAVQLDESLLTAIILGFTETVPLNGEVALNELRSLPDLLLHLNHIRNVSSQPQAVNLSQWLKNIFETDWLSLSDVLGFEQQNLAFSFRNSSYIDESQVKRAKLINLGLQLDTKSVVLLVAIAPENEQTVTIMVQVHPVKSESCLPANLKISLLSESEEILQTVLARSQDNYIQLKRFRGKQGENFQLEINYGDSTIKEHFFI